MGDPSDIFSNQSPLLLASIALFALAAILMLARLQKIREANLWKAKKEELSQRLESCPPEKEIESNQKAQREIEEKIRVGEDFLDKLTVELDALKPTLDMIKLGMYPPIARLVSRFQANKI